MGVAKLKWLLIVFFFFEMSFQGSRPLVSLRMTAMGSSPAEIGTLLAIAGFFPFAIGVPLGGLLDRIGPRRVLVGGSLLACISFVSMAVMSTPYTMAMAFAAGQVGISATMVAGHFVVSLIGTPAEREQNYGWYATATATGQVVGPSLGGVLADHFSIPLVFFYSAVASAVPILLQRQVLATAPPALVAPAAAPPPAAPDRESRRRRGALQLLQVPQVRMMAAAGFLTLMAFDIRTSFLPIYLNGVGLSKSQIGLLYTVFAITGVAVRPMTGLLTRHLGSWRLLALAMAVSVPPLFMMPWATSTLLVGMAMATMGISFGLTQPVTMALAAGAVEQPERGQVFGIRMSAMRLGNLVSPLVLGVVATVAGLPAVFLAAGCFTLTGALVCLRGARTAMRSVSKAAAR